MNLGRYNVVFCLFFFASFAYFLFFFCLSEMFVMLVGYPYTLWLARFSTQMALRKKSVGVPPPLISFFGTCATIGAGGGREKCVCPPHNPLRFFRWGTQYQMSPPRFLGRMNLGRYNVVFCLFFLAFFAYFLFFFCLSEMFVMLVGYPYTLWLARFSTQMALRKKSVGVPPPLISFFGTCATIGAGGGREKCVCPPHNPLRICAPVCVYWFVEWMHPSGRDTLRRSPCLFFFVKWELTIL